MKSALRAIKNEWNDYCEGERLVRELTSNDDEPVAIDKLKRLVYLITEEPQHYQRTYMMIMRRVTDFAYFRHVEKSLITVEYLLKHADQRFARSCKRHVKHFDKLKTYTYSVAGRERGGNVRKTAGRIVALLQSDDELELARARAQGLPKPKKTTSSTDVSKKEDKDDSKNIKPSSAKKQKEKKKEEVVEPKEVKKPKEQLAPTEDLLGDIFTQPTQVNTSPDHWLDDFAVEDQFENHGVGEDGGEFGFGNFDEEPKNNGNGNGNDNDNDNEKQAEETDNADSWMMKLTQLEDPLQGMEKPQKKVNKKGKTMVQMQSNQKDLATTFDNDFLQTINAGLTGQTTTTQPTTQPFVQQQQQPLFSNDPFLFGNTTAPPTHHQGGFIGSFQTQNPFATGVSSGQVNDPFVGLGGRPNNQYAANNGGFVPATYQKPDKADPFSNLAWK